MLFKIHRMKTFFKRKTCVFPDPGTRNDDMERKRNPKRRQTLSFLRSGKSGGFTGGKRNEPVFFPGFPAYHLEKTSNDDIVRDGAETVPFFPAA